LYFMMATQDIAVDGWALTILSKSNVGYASTCNSVGQTLGYFLSYVGFLALNNPETCNKYFRSEPSTEGLVSLGGFIGFWGWAFLIVTVLVWFLKSEKPDDEEDELGVAETYRQLWGVLQLPAVRSLCVILFTCKMGFAATDSITGLKIVEYGLPKEDLALMSTFLVPMGILFPMLIAKFTGGPDPMGMFMLGVLPRVVVGALYMYLVYQMGQATGGGGAVPTWLYVVLMGAALLHEFASNLMFVSQMSFFNRISDPKIGGTYMTLLNTVANLGSKWPTSVVMFLVEPLTTKGCTKLLLDDPPPATGFMRWHGTSCSEACAAASGKCVTTTDGFFTLSTISIGLALGWFVLMQHRVKQLRAFTADKWLL